jgi:transcriptional regulator NrdR family protein
MEEIKAGKGVPCPKCGCCHLRVIYTRHAFARTVRKRECQRCGHRFFTTERIRTK